MNCYGCRWWSELLATAINCEVIFSICLNANSPNHGRMMNYGCKLKRRGKSVDKPIQTEEVKG